MCIGSFDHQCWSWILFFSIFGPRLSLLWNACYSWWRSSSRADQYGTAESLSTGLPRRSQHRRPAVARTGSCRGVLRTTCLYEWHLSQGRLEISIAWTDPTSWTSCICMVWYYLLIEQQNSYWMMPENWVSNVRHYIGFGCEASLDFVKGLLFDAVGACFLEVIGLFAGWVLCLLGNIPGMLFFCLVFWSRLIALSHLLPSSLPFAEHADSAISPPSWTAAAMSSGLPGPLAPPSCHSVLGFASRAQPIGCYTSWKRSVCYFGLSTNQGHSGMVPIPFGLRTKIHFFALSLLPHLHLLLLIRRLPLIAESSDFSASEYIFHSPQDSSSRPESFGPSWSSISWAARISKASWNCCLHTNSDSSASKAQIVLPIFLACSEALDFPHHVSKLLFSDLFQIEFANIHFELWPQWFSTSFFILWRHWKVFCCQKIHFSDFDFPPWPSSIDSSPCRELASEVGPSLCELCFEMLEDVRLSSHGISTELGLPATAKIYLISQTFHSCKTSSSWKSSHLKNHLTSNRSKIRIWKLCSHCHWGGNCSHLLGMMSSWTYIFGLCLTHFVAKMESEKKFASLARSESCTNSNSLVVDSPVMAFWMLSYLIVRVRRNDTRLEMAHLSSTTPHRNPSVWGVWRAIRPRSAIFWMVEMQSLSQVIISLAASVIPWRAACHVDVKSLTASVSRRPCCPWMDYCIFLWVAWTPIKYYLCQKMAVSSAWTPSHSSALMKPPEMGSSDADISSGSCRRWICFVVLDSWFWSSFLLITLI